MYTKRKSNTVGKLRTTIHGNSVNGISLNVEYQVIRNAFTHVTLIVCIAYVNRLNAYVIISKCSLHTHIEQELELITVSTNLFIACSL